MDDVLSKLDDDDLLYVECSMTYLFGLIPFVAACFLKLKLTKIASIIVILISIAYTTAIFSEVLAFNHFLTFLMLYSFFQTKKLRRAELLLFQYILQYLLYFHRIGSSFRFPHHLAC